MSTDLLLTLPQATAFLGAALLVALAPGPDNLMVLSLGMARGGRRGWPGLRAPPEPRCWRRSA
jgi:threonine/homoserine/homoserine lactone efflux protein